MVKQKARLMQVSVSQVACLSELNECDVVNEVKSEECDNPKDLAYLSSSDDTDVLYHTRIYTIRVWYIPYAYTHMV